MDKTEQDKNKHHMCPQRNKKGCWNMKQGQAVMKKMPDKENLIIEIDSICRLTNRKGKAEE